MITLRKGTQGEFLIAIQSIWTSEGAFVTSLQATGENQRPAFMMSKLTLFAADDGRYNTRELP